jgi:hypothetical protein
VALLAAAAPSGARAEELALLQEGQGLSGGGRRSSDVAASPDGRHVYAAAPSWTIALRRRPDGRLARLVGEDVGEYPLGTPGVRVVVTADGGGVLVLLSSPGVAAVVSYLRDAQSGALTVVEAESVNLLGSVYALAASADGTRVFVSSPGQDGIVVYARDPATGALAFAQRVREVDAGVEGLVDPTALAVGPGDRHLYAAAFVQVQGAFREVVALLRREEDGSLAFVEAVETGALVGTPGLGDLALAPDGAELLALDSGSLLARGAAVLRFARDAEDGRLAPPVRETLAAPGFFDGVLSWLALSPDGGRAVFGGLSFVPATEAVVTSYERDPAGALAPRAGVAVGPITTRGAVSPDGRFVYTSDAQGVRVLVPEAGAGAAPAALVALALRRRARRG